MSFLFGGPKFDYNQVGGQATNDMINGLNNFNPWGYQPGLGLLGRQSKQTLMDLYNGKDYSQIGMLKPMFAALNNQYAKNNEMAERNLASGDAALASSGLVKQQAEALRNENFNQMGADASNIVAGAYDRAAGNYANALNSRRSQGLQAAGLALSGKQSGLSGYLDSFKPPTSQSGGLFGTLAQGAGVAASLAGGPIGMGASSLFSKMGGSSGWGGQKYVR